MKKSKFFLTKVAGVVVSAAMVGGVAMAATTYTLDPDTPTTIIITETDDATGTVTTTTPVAINDSNYAETYASYISTNNGVTADPLVLSANHEHRLDVAEGILGNNNAAIARLNGAATVVGSVAHSVAVEATARAAADATLQGNIDAEALTRSTADAALAASIVNERNARIDGDQANADAIAEVVGDLATEVQARIDGDADLLQQISDLSTSSSDAIDAVADAIAAEVTRATGIESGLDTRLGAAEGTILNHTSRIQGLETSAGTVDSRIANAVSAEEVLRSAADSAINADIGNWDHAARGSIASAITTLQQQAQNISATGPLGTSPGFVSPNPTPASQETSFAGTVNVQDNLNVGGDVSVQGGVSIGGQLTIAGVEHDVATAINDNADAIAAEVTRATEAERVLTENLATEVQARIDGDQANADAIAEVAGNLATEVQARIDGDQANADAIAAEVTRATEAERVLTENLATEVQARIDGDQANADAIAAEVERATAAEEALSGRLTTVEGNVQNIRSSEVGQTEVLGDLSVERDLSVGRDLSVERDVTIGRDLSVARDVSVGRDLSVARNVSVGGEVTIDAKPGVREVNVQKDIIANEKAIAAETKRAKKEEKRLDKKFSQTDSVIGATLVNIIASEFTPEELKADGISFNGSVGQKDDGVAEVVIGVGKKLDNGFSVGAGVGTESGEVNVHAGWKHSLNENVHVGVGASLSESGVQVGPQASVTTDDGQFGAGVSTFGPSVILGGVNVPVLAPQVGLANVVVAGLSKAYNAVAEKREAPVKELKAEVATLKAEKAKFEADLAAMKAEMEEFKAILKASKKK